MLIAQKAACATLFTACTQALHVRQEHVVTVTATVTKTATAIVTDETTGWNAALASLATASVTNTASWQSVLSEASVYMAKASPLSSELDQASRDAASARSGLHASATSIASALRNAGNELASDGASIATDFASEIVDTGNAVTSAIGDFFDSKGFRQAHSANSVARTTMFLLWLAPLLLRL